MGQLDSIQVRKGTAAAWALANPVLDLGEPGAAIDGSDITFKVGDGVTAWNALPYANQDVVEAAILANGSSGRRLDYAESNAAITGIAGTVVAISPRPIEFTVGARPVEVRGRVDFVVGVGATANVRYAIATAAAPTVPLRDVSRAHTVSGFFPVEVEASFGTPGDYEVVMTAVRFGGTGTVNVGLNAQTFVSLGAYEV